MAVAVFVHDDNPASAAAPMMPESPGPSQARWEKYSAQVHGRRNASPPSLEQPFWILRRRCSAKIKFTQMLHLI